MTGQLKAALLSIQTSLGNQSLRQQLTGYRTVPSAMQGGRPQSRPKAVCSLVRKVTSFWLNSKERKLAGCLVGYPDWKSALTLSFASSLPTFWCKFLKEECDVSTCWFAHTHGARDTSPTQSSCDTSEPEVGRTGNRLRKLKSFLVKPHQMVVFGPPTVIPWILRINNDE